MLLLPTAEERDWLAHSLRKLFAQHDRSLLDAAPCVTPTDDWFPEIWEPTPAKAHLLTQRLMHYAGLESLPLRLEAFDDETAENVWDGGTAGLFYGIEDGRARIGLHVREFGDAEVAAGVLAHEVAHAFREHHALVVHDREKEEFLTDLTTIALGFGILTTNNTDRYRSTGNYSQTSWSTSSVGYLPPHAMAYALALWLRARGDDEEVRSAKKHLEPNQLACFKAALEDLDSEEKPVRERLGVRDRTCTSIDWKAFVPRNPSPDEVYEPDLDEDADPHSNAGETVYATPNDSSFAVGIWAAIAGFTVGWIAGIVTFDGMASLRPVWLGLVLATISGYLAHRMARRLVCSECHTALQRTAPTCPACGGTNGGFKSDNELRILREEEFDRRAQEEIPFQECDECEPELPCDAHRGTPDE
jgi:hypothetical protein